MLVRVWQCADGRLIPLNQMDRSHILNCIARIQRKGNWRRDWLEPLQLELNIRDLTSKDVQ